MNQQMCDTVLSKQIKASYSIDFKITVIKFAENNSNRKVEKHFGVNELFIRGWRKNKEFRMILNKSRKTVFKRHKPKWTALAKRK